MKNNTLIFYSYDVTIIIHLSKVIKLVYTDVLFIVFRVYYLSYSQIEMNQERGNKIFFLISIMQLYVTGIFLLKPTLFGF